MLIEEVRHRLVSLLQGQSGELLTHLSLGCHLDLLRIVDKAILDMVVHIS